MAKGKKSQANDIEREDDPGDWAYVLSDFDFGDNEDNDNDSDDVIADLSLSRVIRHDVKAEKQLFLYESKKRSLELLLPELPPPDTTVYIILAGLGAEANRNTIAKSPDLGTFIPHVLDLLGTSENTAYISTWTMNHNHSKMLIDLLDTNRLATLTFFTDPYFMQRTPAIANPFVLEMQKRNQLVKMFKCHAKIIAIATPNNTKSVCIFSSANLSAQPRTENLTLSTSLDLYNWVKTEYFEKILSNGKP